MPLPADVGEAIVRYLQHGRPHSPCRRLFLRHAAPKTGFANSGAISTLVRRTIIRAGIDSQRKGSHLFRHSLATRMINEGSSFPEIAELGTNRSKRQTSMRKLIFRLSEASHCRGREVRDDSTTPSRPGLPGSAPQSGIQASLHRGFALEVHRLR
jgi:integrase